MTGEAKELVRHRVKDMVMVKTEVFPRRVNDTEYHGVRLVD